MAERSTLEASAGERVREALGALTGVIRVVVDEAMDTVCLICEPSAEATPLDLMAREALLAEGIDPAGLRLEVAVHPGQGSRQRVQFRSVERLPRDHGQLGVRVTLQWRGELFTGEASGETGPAIEQRTAAAAALQAVKSLIGQEVGLRLIGVKQLRAFDADLIVSSIHRPGPPSQRYVGAVLAPDDPLHGATISVLHALNRMMGNFLATTD